MKNRELIAALSVGLVAIIATGNFVSFPIFVPYFFHQKGAQALLADYRHNLARYLIRAYATGFPLGILIFLIRDVANPFGELQILERFLKSIAVGMAIGLGTAFGIWLGSISSKRLRK